MKATIENMTTVFKECNEKYFNNSLPRPRFAVMHSWAKSGEFVYEPRKTDKGRILKRSIYMTDCFDFTEKQFRDIMAHEMIHYFIAWNHIKDDDDHGTEFMKMAERLNKEHGFNITKKIDVCPKEHTPKNKTHKLLIKIKSFLLKLV